MDVITFAIFVVILVIFYLFASVKIVRQGHRYTIERFGKFTEVASPGFNVYPAFFYRVGRKINMMEQVIDVPAEGAPIVQVLKSSGVVPSTSEAHRMIEQGGVKVNGEKVSDKSLRLDAGATYVLQVGKRKFAKVALRTAA